ncbi:TetR family transcriptional regulator [Hyphomicrobiales bacterium]|nr:TetR family transcriptional regulator [Hyphomicrobiales bacterium]CAH1687710.1 TetR family transcriptional regulator [Hyphomicrobiales bacterium]
MMAHATAPERSRNASHDRRRAEIIRAAVRHFWEKGSEATSLQSIADAIGVRKATLYYYFAAKDELIEAVLVDIITKGVRNIAELASLNDDPLTRLWRLIASHIDHVCENLIETAVFLHERKRWTLEQRQRILSDDYRYQQIFISTIREGQAAGQIRPEIDPTIAALSILGSTNWTYTWYRPGGDLEPALIGAQFATLTANSLATSDTLQLWRSPLSPLPSHG